MNKQIWLAYLHVAHAKAKTDIEASLLDSHIQTITDEITHDGFLRYINDFVTDKSIQELQDPDALACLLTCSYHVTNEDACDTYAILITEIEYVCKQSQSSLEEEIREKTWSMLRVLHPQQHAQFEKASKAMIGKAMLTVLKRRILTDTVTQHTPSPTNNALTLHWIEGFLKILRKVPRNAKLVWE